MSKAVRFSSSAVVPEFPSRVLARPAPSLPGELVQHIATMSSRFRDLSALSMLSSSWRSACTPVINQVRNMALDCRSAASEPLILARKKCQAFALDFALQRLSRKASTEAFDSVVHTAVTRNLPKLWTLNGRHRNLFSQIAGLLFNLKGVDQPTWDLLIELSAPKGRTLQILALDPDALPVFSDHEKAAILSEAADSLEQLLECTPDGGGAMRDYANVISKLGERTSPAFCSPFHRILFASLLYRKDAFYGLIQLATECNAADFFDFCARVRKHFAGDDNVEVALNLAAARWLGKATPDELATLPLAVLMETTQQAFRQCQDMKGLTGAQRELVLAERSPLLEKIAENASTIVNAIPADKPKQRAKVLKPLMAYLRSCPPTSKETGLKVAIKRQAEQENWLPGNPKL